MSFHSLHFRSSPTHFNSGAASSSPAHFNFRSCKQQPRSLQLQEQRQQPFTFTFTSLILHSPQNLNSRIPLAAPEAQTRNGSELLQRRRQPDPDPHPPPRGYALSGKVMLSGIVVLFTIVLLILFIHLYVRWHVSRRSRRRRNPLVFNEDDSTGNRPAPPAPRGLDPKVLNSLAVLLFSAKDLEAAAEEGCADVSAAECAVCISEFEEGEKVRILPRCGHCFHIACIDMWFGSHNSCPLCRSAVEAPPPPEAEAKLGFFEPQRCAAAPSTESSSSTADQEVRVEILSREGEAGLGFGRIWAIKRFWSRDLRSGRGERDLERGEAGERDPPATTALPAAATE